MVCKKRYRREAAGFLFTGVLGTLLHFTYDLSGSAAWTAAFSAVNESTWEHMKILFFPMLAWTLIELLAGRRGVPAVRGVSAAAGVSLIPVLFYTYTGILGRNVTWANIAIFYLSAAAAFGVDGTLRRRGVLRGRWIQPAGLAVLLGLAAAFVFCTWKPPMLPLWQDPLTGGYGILP